MTVSIAGKFTPDACLEAISAWLEDEWAFVPGTARLLDIDGRLWLEFSEITSTDPAVDDVPTSLRGILVSRAPADIAAPLPNGEGLIVTLYEMDPTPVVTMTSFGSSTTSPVAGHTLVVIGHRGSITVARGRPAPASWGERLHWPF